MKPEVRSHFVVRRPHLIVLALLLAAGSASAQPRTKKQQKERDKAPAAAKKDEKPKVFDFTGLQFEGRLRTPQLLYFLDRASEELERASLERRSFLREVVRSVDEEEL